MKFSNCGSTIAVEAIY